MTQAFSKLNVHELEEVIEKQMVKVVKRFESGITSKFEAESEFSGVLKGLSEKDAEKWSGVFNGEIDKVQVSKEMILECRANRFRRVFIFLEVVFIMFLLPLKIWIFVSSIELSYTLLEILIKVTMGLLYIFMITKYNDYWTWRKRKGAG